MPSASPEGKSSDDVRARPMSSVQVSGPVMCGRISPAPVWIEKRSASVQPLRRRNMHASRAPLPDSPASEPSGLKIRRRATKPGASGSESSRMPSDPTPVWTSQMRSMRAAVSSNGSVRSSTMR